jgi:peptidoglycan/LPS O-acetylase OafA/YrhL
MSSDLQTPYPRNNNIQSLRGFAALLVVLSHLLIIEQKYSPDHILGQWAEFGMAGVDLFFVISGFIMVYVTRAGTPAGPKTSLKFLFARLTRIYPLYWVISAALLAVYVWRPELVFSSQPEHPHILKSFFLWPDNLPPLLAVGWTLIHEIGFYVVFAFFLLFRARTLPYFLLAWMMVLAGSQIVFTDIVHQPVTALILNPLSFEFIAGAFAALIYLKTGAKFAPYILMLGIIVATIVLIALANNGMGMPQNYGQRTLYFCGPAVMILYGLAGLKTTLPRWTHILGEHSYSLYLTHVLTLSVLGRLWHIFAREGIIDNIIALALMTAITIWVSALVYTYCEYPMLQFSKNLRQKLFPPS